MADRFFSVEDHVLEYLFEVGVDDWEKRVRAMMNLLKYADLFHHSEINHVYTLGKSLVEKVDSPETAYDLKVALVKFYNKHSDKIEKM